MSDNKNIPKKPLPSLGEKNTDYVPPWETQALKVKNTKEAMALREERKKRNHQKFVRAKWRNRGILVSLVFLIIWFYNPHGIFVLGDPLSVGRYRGVLKDLKKQMPEEYEMVKNHIDKIRISYFIPGGNYAGYAQESGDGSKNITLLENTFVQGPGYAHSVLVHEACHGLQFEKNLPFTGKCNKQSREHACTQMALKVLRQFDGNLEMIAHYETLSVGDTEYGNSCARRGDIEFMPAL